MPATRLPLVSSRCPRRAVAAVGAAALMTAASVSGCRASLSEAHAADRSAALDLAPPEAEALRADPVLTALVDELARNADGLRLEGHRAPYYLAFAVHQEASWSVAGKLGAVHAETATERKQAYVDVRVGDYGFDSSEDPELDWVPDAAFFPDALLPLGDDPAALRHTFWLLSDLRYKQALASFSKLEGERVYEPEDRDARASFSRAPALEHAEDLVALEVSQPRWHAVVAEIGAQLGEAAFVFDHAVQVDTSVRTRWLVDTDGVRVRTVEPRYAVHVQAYARADDGMLLEHGLDLYAPTEAQLPTDAALALEVDRMLDELEALRQAPVLEPYTGPILLEPAATGVFFHEVLGHRLEGHRQDADEEGQTFARHLGKAILPSFLSVLDDPTRTTAADTPLNGHYRVDEEGVIASPVTLVAQGVLTDFLQARRPVKGFSASNGHGRAQGTARPVARMGNLIVEAHETVPTASLKDRLIALAKSQGKPFGLIVRDITGGSTNTSSYGYQAFKGEARMVYKVDADTGAETLVRGVELVGTPLAALGKIVAAGDDTGVFNGYCGAESGLVPVSTVAPATLFREMELQRSLKARSKPTVLGAPPRRMDIRPAARVEGQPTTRPRHRAVAPEASEGGRRW